MCLSIITCKEGFDFCLNNVLVACRNERLISISVNSDVDPELLKETGA